MSNRIRGITVEIGDDTTKLSKALEGVNKNIKNTQTQLKDVEKLLKLDPTNTELLSQKQKLLADAVSSTSDKLETLKKASEQAAKTKDNYDAWKAKYDPIKQKITETETKLKDLKEQAKTADEQLSKGEISQEKYDALQKEIKETTDELTSLKDSAKAVSDEFGNPISPQQYDSLQREIVETQQELQNLQREAENSRTALVKIGEAGATMEKVGDKISGAGEKLLPLTASITALGTMAVKTTADFDAVMSKVSAVSGATGEELDALRAKAREMGSQTKFSASEAGEALNYMAMAGWKTEDMLNGIDGIMNLAAASGEDLATTSDIVTDALTALGITILGYKRNKDGVLEIVPEEAEIIRMIFNDYLNGMGKQAIANKLHGLQIQTKGGGLWTAGAIKRILKNEKYCGDLLLQKSFRENHITKKKIENSGQLPQFYVEGSHEPIIDKETFLAVQELLKENQRFTPSVSTTNTYPLTGIIKCGCCGRYYRRKVQPYRVTWICWTYNARGKKYCPTSKQIPEDIMYEKCCEVLQLDEFDNEIFQSEIKKILVPEPNVLTFVFKDGHKQTVHWLDHSRSESWTPEMREEAAQNTREKRWKSCQK